MGAFGNWMKIARDDRWDDESHKEPIFKMNMLFVGSILRWSTTVTLKQSYAKRKKDHAERKKNNLARNIETMMLAKTLMFCSKNRSLVIFSHFQKPAVTYCFFSNLFQSLPPFDFAFITRGFYFYFCHAKIRDSSKTYTD